MLFQQFALGSLPAHAVRSLEPLKPSGSTGVSVCQGLRTPVSPSSLPWALQPPLAMAQEPLSAHPGALSADLSYRTAPAVLTAVPQTGTEAWCQPCPVTLGLPGTPGGHWLEQGGTSSLDCILMWKVGLGRWAQGLTHPKRN